MEKPCKVLVEGSVFADYQRNGCKPSGISRVSMEILGRMMEDPGFEVHIYNERGYDCHAWDYLRAWHRHTDFHPVRNLRQIIFNPLALLVRHFSGPGSKGLSTSIARLLRAAWLVLTGSGQPPRRVLESMDLVMSPFPLLKSTFPDSLPRLYVLYDAIPALFPGFCEPENPFYRFLSEVRPADWFAAISESSRKDFLELRPDIDPGHVGVFPLGIEPRLMIPQTGDAILGVRKKYGIPEGSGYLLTLFTLEPRKNLSAVLDAWEEAKSLISPMCLVIAGSLGWKSTEITQRIKAMQERDSALIVTGFVEDQDLPALYAGASAFLYPSHYEGFSLPPLEAMIHGTPAIVANTSCFPEIYGDSSLMVSPDKPQELKDAIVRLVTDEEEHRVRSSKAKIHASGFTRESSWARLRPLILAHAKNGKNP